MGLFDRFLKKKYHEGPIVDLKEKYRVSEREAYDGVPTVYYDIYTHTDHKKIGATDLRLKSDGDMYFYGNIGYHILPNYRGNHYAYEACKMLFEIARKEFKMDELIITCSPENIPSYKTLLKLNGELLELVDVPKNHYLYMIGEKKKYIFKYKL